MSDGVWLLPYLAALISGLVGGVHCVGMCGGIVGTMTLGIARHPLRVQLPYHLAYNGGRITSYLLAGALMGGVGMLLAGWLPLYLAQRLLLLLAGVFMLLLGLYLGGWWSLLGGLERLAGGVWRRLEPWARQLLPIRDRWQAFRVGLVWGWIPCGLVYAMLANAIATGSPLGGALVMLAFGLGTLPNLLGVGLLAGAAAHLAHSPLARQIAGGIMILFGVATLWSAW